VEWLTQIARRRSQVASFRLQTEDGSEEMEEKITANGKPLNIEPRTLIIKPH
jgi:hypothetical protein